MLHLIGPDRISIPLFIGHQLIQVNQDIEEDTALLALPQELIESKLDAVLGFQQIDHLTHDILEVDDQFVIQKGQPLALLLKEMLELISRDNAIIIEINDLKPILNAGFGSLILLGEYKPHKITKPHPLAILLELPRALREYPLD